MTSATLKWWLLLSEPTSRASRWSLCVWLAAVCPGIKAAESEVFSDSCSVGVAGRVRIAPRAARRGLRPDFPRDGLAEGGGHAMEAVAPGVVDRSAATRED